MRIVIFYLFLSLSSLAQKDSLREIITPNPLVDCAHSHDCCSIRCSCCSLVHRDQVYDTSIIEIPNTNIERLEIKARYDIAKQRIPSQLKYIFRYNKDSLSEVYYDASNLHTGFFYYYASQEKNIAPENFKTDELVFTQSGDYILLNAQGEPKKIKYHTKEALSNGDFLVSIFLNENRILGIVDENDNKLSQLKYNEIELIEECGVYIYNSSQSNFSLSYGLLNENFEEIALEAAYIEHLVGDVFKMRDMKGECLINKKGEKISDYYRKIYNYSEGLIYAKKDDDKKSVFMDAYGKVKFRIKCDHAAAFSDGLARFSVNNRWGFVDLNGKIVIEAKYFNAHDFEDGTAPVALGINYGNVKWALIDKQGKFLFDPVYDKMEAFKYGVTVVAKRGSGSGLMNTKGKLVLREKYQLNSYGHFLYQNDKLRVLCLDINSKEYVLLDENMKLDRRFNTYNHVSFLFDKPINGRIYIMAIKNDKRFLLNEKGEQIVDGPLKSIGVLGQNHSLILRKEGGKGAILYDPKRMTVLRNLPEDVTINANKGFLKFTREDAVSKYFNLKGEEFFPFY